MALYVEFEKISKVAGPWRGMRVGQLSSPHSVCFRQRASAKLEKLLPQRKQSSVSSLSGGQEQSALGEALPLPVSRAPDVGEGRKGGWEGSRRRGGGARWGGGGEDGKSERELGSQPTPARAAAGRGWSLPRRCRTRL